MYSNKLVACIKVDGKVLREKGDEVYLPFGSEYTLYFKNEHSRKVQINVAIDGQDILFGKTLLLDAYDTMDLKGFVKDKDGADNRAFRFITKTQEISDFRGDRAEDGLVKITYQFEKEINSFERPTLRGPSYPFDIYTNGSVRYGDAQPWSKGGLSMSNAVYSDTSSGNISSMNINCSASASGSTMHTTSLTSRSMVTSNDPGITVEGKATNQAFKIGHIGILEDKIHSMIFQLKGLTSEEQIDEPITIETKKQCTSCGKKFKSTFEYCPFDGTFLRL